MNLGVFLDAAKGEAEAALAKAAEQATVEGDKVKKLKLTLKYQGRKGVITDLRRISRPGLRIYAPSDRIPRVMNGLGMALISTSQGIMTDRDARAKKVGGEVLAYVW